MHQRITCEKRNAEIRTNNTSIIYCSCNTNTIMHVYFFLFSCASQFSAVIMQVLIINLHYSLGILIVVEIRNFFFLNVKNVKKHFDHLTQYILLPICLKIHLNNYYFHANPLCLWIRKVEEIICINTFYS